MLWPFGGRVPPRGARPRLCRREGRAQSPGFPRLEGRGVSLHGVTAMPGFVGRIGVAGSDAGGEGALERIAAFLGGGGGHPS